MINSLLNTQEFYSTLASSGYLNGYRKNNNYSQAEARAQDAFKIADGGISSGNASHPDSINNVETPAYLYNPNEPVREAWNSFKTVFDNVLNKKNILGDDNITAPVNSRIKSASSKSNTSSGSGFFLTIPDEQLNEMKVNSPASFKDKVAQLYTGSYNMTGALVNLSI
ncbi:MAG: hypothetical protein ACM3RX_05335 [Methanococcaceae archaeon]